MQVVVLKSNIKTSEEVCRLAPIFDLHPRIINWSVDYEDIDHVLRVEIDSGLSGKKLRKLLKNYGVEVGKL